MTEVSSPDWLTLAFWTRDPESVQNLFLVVGGLIGFLLLLWRTCNIHRQTNTDRERRITESFTCAVEQLGSDKLETRLGAIYALERIARESRVDHWPIMETLTAYIRERAHWPPIKMVEGSAIFGNKPIKKREQATDVLACLTVVTRRRRKYDRREQRLDLTYTDLRETNLADAHLEEVDFTGAHLEHAILTEANLEGAWFVKAHLEGASLTRARLKWVWFKEAHLEGADLWGTDLTQEQFDDASSNERTTVPPHIKRRGKPGGKPAEDQHEVAAIPSQ